jgi:hypothetical protein
MKQRIMFYHGKRHEICCACHVGLLSRLQTLAPIAVSKQLDITVTSASFGMMI